MLKTLVYTAAFTALIALAAGVATLTPAHAGTSCTDKDVNAEGSLFGSDFNVPADTRSLTGPSDNFVKLTSEDCVNNQSDEISKARRDGRRAASIGASMDAYGWSEGLNLTLNGANTGLGNDDTYAAGLATGYKHTFAQPLGGILHGIAGKAAFSADTTGSDYGAAIGLTLNFGTF